MKRQEGQALVIAALAVLILAIAVLTTVNVGHAVNERVRLQNTSDAAAYTMAAMEARAFNFYAFANRTQVSHYVTQMLWQSMLSFAYWAEAFLVDVYGVMKTIDVCAGSRNAFWTVVCPILMAIPILGTIISVITTVINVYRSFLSIAILPAIRLANPDYYVGKWVIPAYRVMNELLAAASQATLAATLIHVGQTSQDVIVANDPQISATPQKAVSSLLSLCMLTRAHYDETKIHPTSVLNVSAPFTQLNPTLLAAADKTARAKRVMGNISNATRFACDRPGSNCGPGWVTSRKPLDLISLPGAMNVIKQYLELLPDWKWGSTKMLSYTFSRGYRARNQNDRRGGNFIRDWQDTPTAPIGELAQGDAMGSDDIYQIKLGPPTIGFAGIGVTNPLSCDVNDSNDDCWGDPSVGRWDNSRRDLPFRATNETSIWAMSNNEVPGGLHWRLVYPTGGGRMYPSSATWADRPIRYPSPNIVEARIGLSQSQRSYLWGAIKVDVWVANTRMVRDGNHPWDGITPFAHFEPGQYQGACGPGVGSPDPSTAANRRTSTNGMQEEFNQPSSFMILKKYANEMENMGDTTGAGNVKPAMLNTQKSLTFEFARPTRLTFDDTRTSFLGGKGLNVVSRSQTYYHRPGNWHEQPNFFNPYWRPRLAAVWQGYTQFPFASQVSNALPGPMRNSVQKFMTH